MQNIRILAIESSCDETSAAIIHNGKILSNVVASQEVHHQYGGVVPELASRAHQKNIVPVVDAALTKANIKKNELNAVAFTKGPGLLGALLVGASFSKAFALALGIPLIEVNHMQAHVLAHFIDKPQPAFPFLCLTVSGGHTQIVLVRDYLDMEVIGETQDDAVGEAFDKTAKLIGLPYPGGPQIDRLAQQGNPAAFVFPDVQVPGYNYSFSGIKTAILNFLKKNIQKDQNFIEDHIHDICASVQQTLIRLLIDKLQKAASDLKIKEIAVAGGVAANSGLRKALKKWCEQKKYNIYIPDFQYCTDNAAMIAMAAHYQYKQKQFVDQSAYATARLKIS